jgi:hypothetical protein
MTDFEKGKKEGIKKALKILEDMERRFEHWKANRADLYNQEAIEAKISAIRTAKRAVEKL